MNPVPVDKNEDILSLLKRNNELLEQNQVLLKKMDLRERRSFWIKLIWYVILFGLPLLFYSYFINGIMAMMDVSGSDNSSNSGIEINVEDMQKALNLLQNK